jgi:hypothetical protein
MSEESVPEVDAPLRLHGVSLEQYAAVSAALAEPFPLDDVLAIEEIASDAWAEASSEWKARLVEGSAGAGELFEDYRRELAAAEDRLARRVAPLDDDIEAWISFLHAYSSDPAAFDLLQGLGLGLNDVSRLQRRWTGRIAADAALQKRAAKLEGKKPGRLPPITVEQAQLRRSPAAAQAAERAAALPAKEERGLEIEHLRLDQYAALRAELEVFPDEPDRAFAKHGLSTEAARAAADRRWREEIAGDPALERDFERLFNHSHQRYVAISRNRLPDVAEGDAGPKPDPAPRAGEPPSPSAAPNLPRSAATSRSTQPMIVKTGALLPFHAGGDADSRAWERAVTHADSVQGQAAPRPAAAIGTTADLDVVIASPLLPFAARPARAEDAPAPELTLQQYASLCVEIDLFPERVAQTLARYRLTLGARIRLDADWQGRFARDPALRSDFARAYGTFKQHLTGATAAEAPIQETKSANKTQEMPFFDKNDIADTLPFNRPSDPPSKPSLTLEQHAWLYAELTVFPERRADILQRYGLDGELGKQREDAAWGRRLTSGGTIAEKWRRLVGDCRQWLEQQRKP